MSGLRWTGARHARVLHVCRSAAVWVAPAPWRVWLLVCTCQLQQQLGQSVSSNPPHHTTPQHRTAITAYGSSCHRRFWSEEAETELLRLHLFRFHSNGECSASKFQKEKKKKKPRSGKLSIHQTGSVTNSNECYRWINCQLPNTNFVAGRLG